MPPRHEVPEDAFEVVVEWDHFTQIDVGLGAGFRDESTKRRCVDDLGGHRIGVDGYRSDT